MKNGKFAIVMAYFCEQNEPSNPDSALLFVPDDPDERKKVLQDEFVTSFAEGYPDTTQGPDEFGLASWDELTITEPQEGGYGDIGITAGGDAHLLLTFLADEHQSQLEQANAGVRS